MGAFVAFDDQAFAPDVESPYLVAPFVEHFARDRKTSGSRSMNGCTCRIAGLIVIFIV